MLVFGKVRDLLDSEAVGRIEHSRPEPRDRAVDLDSECWQMRANCIGNMTWRQVPIVFANHARIRMPKCLSDDGQAHAGLHREDA